MPDKGIYGIEEIKGSVDANADISGDITSIEKISGNIDNADMPILQGNISSQQSSIAGTLSNQHDIEGKVSSPKIISSYNELKDIPKIEGNELVRNFKPCRHRFLDGYEGLYETIEGKLYVNQGTGTFSIGADTGEKW